ncbi:acyltransferase domain-containing protein [Streptomyces sp. P9(2023)]|uniref:acyltransferase domain-containing protein n=1 Tax=Streptomyces sp. P9(2023) TaxID=3064394 RepID=UPI0028F423A3|nr:acyltransferase domain-containing protein [Streptomyces sp. P9(2023)]MDT9686768.1 acyltransferase domain-containing protein [Streptomyces sp. P9(2023)]
MTSTDDTTGIASTHAELARRAVSALVKIADTDHWGKDLHQELTYFLAGASSAQAEHYYMVWLDEWRERWMAAREEGDQDAEAAAEADFREEVRSALGWRPSARRELRSKVGKWTQADRQLLTAADIRKALGLGEEFRGWTEALEEVTGPFLSPDIPEGDELIALMEELEIPQEDHADIAAAVDAVTDVDSSWLWLLERIFSLIRSRMGNSLNIPVGPVMRDHGSAGWWFYVVAFLAAAPAVRGFHRLIKVPAETSAATLGILGEKIAVYRRGDSGHGGLVQHDYVMAAFCGRLYRLEQLDCLAWNGQVDVRVPHGAHPLTTVPDQAWADRVHAFFRRLPQEYGQGIRWGQSALTVNVEGWMVDPDLNDYLPEDHDLRRFVAELGSFTRRHDLHPAQDQLGLTGGDRDAIEYAFGRYVWDLGDALALTAETDTQRAVLAHLQAGHHWTRPAAGHPIFSY